MKVFKNLFGRGDKIHVDEIAVAPGLLLGGAVIVESGSNENGEYVRFGDGTQMCWHHVGNWPGSMPATATGSLYRSSADLVWTYPKPFVDEPYADGSSSGYSWVNDAGGANRDNTESYSFRVYRSAAATVNPHIRLWAIGRWK